MSNIAPKVVRRCKDSMQSILPMKLTGFMVSSHFRSARVLQKFGKMCHKNQLKTFSAGSHPEFTPFLPVLAACLDLCVLLSCRLQFNEGFLIIRSNAKKINPLICDEITGSCPKSLDNQGNPLMVGKYASCMQYLTLSNTFGLWGREGS